MSAPNNPDEETGRLRNADECVVRVAMDFEGVTP